MKYSFSSIATFQTCPHKFKLKYIDKIKIIFESNIALEKGKYIHSMIEYHLKNTELQKFNFQLSSKKDIQEYNNIITKFISSNLFNVLTSNFEKIEVERGFSLILNNRELKALPNYKSNALLRGYIDFIGYNFKTNTITIIDWKTGKFKEEQNPLQVISYALWAFLMFPEIKEVHTYYVFVEHDKYNKQIFTKNEIDNLKKELLKNIRDIELAKRNNNFPKKPSKLCDWCEFKKFEHCDGEYDLTKLKGVTWK